MSKHRQEGSKLIEVRGKEQISHELKPIGDEAAPVTVSRTDTHLNISILLDHIRKTPNFDIVNAVNLAISPIFTNENKGTIQKSISGKTKSCPHIGFFIEDRGHYTGGRYSTWMTAVILSQVTRVTVITNAEPAFYNDIHPYFNDNFRYHIDSSYGSKNSKPYDFDLVVGVPQLSGQYAAQYAEVHKISFYAWMFESPNFVREFRDGVDATDDYWESYKKCLMQADKVILPSYESEKWFKEWDAAFVNKQTCVLYPCLNEFVIKKTKKITNAGNRTRVIFSSRMAEFKNPLPIIKLLPKAWQYDIIGKCSNDNINMIMKMRDDGYRIEVYQSCEDSVKFSHIYAADVLIHPSKFEGFGMSPMEALHLGTSVVVFDLPVLREIYGNMIHYAKFGDRQAFAQKVREVVNSHAKIVKLPAKQMGFRHIYTHLEKAKEIFNIPKISFGVLAYNCADYLEYVISSVYHLAHEIIIVEGAVKGYASDPNSNDGTVELIEKLGKMDHWNKIKFIQATKKSKPDFWKDKIEMQNTIAEFVTGDFYIKMDADEIWRSESVIGVMDLFYNNPNLTVVKMPFLHFWTAFNKIAKDAGGKWGTKHPRVWRWKSSFWHRGSFNHFIDKSCDNRAVCSPYVEEYDYEGYPVYHFGYARKLDFVTQKLQYYKGRGIETYVEDTYKKWKDMNDQTQPTQRVRSWAEDFNPDHLPKIMKKHPYFNAKDIRKLKPGKKK